MGDTRQDHKRRLLPLAIGVGVLVVLWIVTFYATGLMWWKAPDLYGGPIPRPDPLYPPGSVQALVDRQPPADAESAPPESQSPESQP